MTFSEPILVFGGPYSNLQAVESLKAEAERRGIPPDRIICTGDVVAYCAQPEETVALIRAWGIHVIQGNCEEQLAAQADDCGCGFDSGSACDQLAKSWYEFAGRRLSEASRRWMGRRPRTLVFEIGGVRARVIHGGVTQINRFVFASQTGILQAEQAAAGTELVIAGHCGLPFVRELGTATWFNPGVIGMPANDGTARVWYGLIEPRQNAKPGSAGIELSIHPLSYDHAGATQALRAHGHADAYALALETGLWPSLDILPQVEQAATGRPLQALRHHLASVG